VAGDLQSRAGIGLRTAHLRQIAAAPPPAGFLEIHAENYMGDSPAVALLERIRRDNELSVHGVGLSLGSADGLDQTHLQRLKAVADRFQPRLLSEHLSWSIAGGAYLNDLLPLPYTQEALALVARNVSHAQETLGRRLLIENPSRYLRFAASVIPEEEFLAELVRRTGCGLLCDVNNLFVSCHNTTGDPLRWLDAIPADAVGEFHVAGHAVNDADGRTMLIDNHGSRVHGAVWRLLAEAVARIGLRPVLVEWDTDVPELAVLLAEAAQADAVLARSQRGRHVA
jgi:uncharacterized protein (UPF0276 family)